MNVLFLNHHALSPDMPGGTRHYDLSRKLIAKGHRVTIFASSYHYATFKEYREYTDNWYINEKIEGINWYWIKTPKYTSNGIKRIFNMLVYYFRAIALGKKVFNTKPDVIIGSIVHPFAPLAAIKLKKYFNTKYLFEIRDLWPQTMIDMKVWKPDSFMSKFFFAIEQKSVKHADGIVALSPLTSGYIEKKYGKREVTYIPNGIDLQSYDKRYAQFTNSDISIDTFNKLDNIKNKGYKIIEFIGSVNLSNNIDLIVELADKLSESKVFVAIIGQGQKLEHYKNLIKKRGLDNIDFLSPVDKKYVPVLLDKADILLSLQGKVMWGSMNKLFDYMAAGKPIINMVENKHNNPIKNVEPGLNVDTKDRKKLIEAVEYALKMTDDNLLNYKQKVRKILESNYDIEHLANKLEQLLARNIQQISPLNLLPPEQ